MKVVKNTDSAGEIFVNNYIGSQYTISTWEKLGKLISFNIVKIEESVFFVYEWNDENIEKYEKIWSENEVSILRKRVRPVPYKKFMSLLKAEFDGIDNKYKRTIESVLSAKRLTHNS